MAAIDFPNSPTLNQEFTANGRTWIWNGTVWANKASNTSVSRYNVSDTAPTSPTNGDVWFNSTNARTYVYYDSFWVESNPALDGKSGTVAVASPLTNTGTDTAAVLGVDYSALQYGQNAIINGAFDIWQRGTSITPASGYGFGADRWQVYSAATSTGTMSQQTFTPGAAPVSGYEGTYFMRVRSTNTGTWFKQNIEDVRTFAGQTVTLSFWAKSSTAASIGFLPAQEFGSGGSALVDIPAGSVFDLTTSWARYTRTFSVPSIAGKTIGANSLFRALFYTATINVDFDIWGVQLEAGSVATPFKRHAPSIQGELAACQRYFLRLGGKASYEPLAVGQLYNSTSGVYSVFFPVTMRATPSFSVSSSWANSFLITNGLDGSATVSSAPTANIGGEKMFRFYAAASSLGSGGSGQGSLFLVNANANGYLDFSSEL